MSKTTPRVLFEALIGQLSRIWKSIIVGIVISLGGTGFTVLLAKLTGYSVWELAKDPTEVAGVPPYTGMLSSWGVLLWVMTAAICLFCAVLLKRHHASNVSFGFLAASGVLSLCLGIDDLYMLHELLLPRISNLPEMFFYLLYFVAFIVYLFCFASRILKHDYLLLAVAVFWFAFSRSYFGISYLERFMTMDDMLKHIGIVFWLIFFFRASLQEVSALLDRQTQTLSKPLGG